MARSVTGSNIGLSFIDVLASALGAAVLLFVILASTPIATTSGAHACGTFLRYEWSVSGDPDARLRLVVSSPDQNTGLPQVIDLDELNSSTIIKRQISAESSMALFGFAQNARDRDGRNQRHYVLRLNQPTPGLWSVGLLFFDRPNRSLAAAPSDISIRTKLSSEAGPAPAATQHVINSFGRILETSSIDADIAVSFGTALMTRAEARGSTNSNAGCS